MKPEKGKKADERILRVIIAGAGTGGHLFPGLAIADSLCEDNPENEVLFVGAGTALEERVLPQSGFAFTKIAAEGLKGRSLLSRIRSIFKLLSGIIRSIGILRRFKPDIVLGMGGYSSAPVVICARLFGVKIVLHEQNALPGMTNRMLSRLADKVCVSQEKAGEKLPIAPAKWVLTGNPVRQELQQLRPEDEFRTGRKNRFQVFILGGSQGAHSINMAVVGALQYMENKENFFFVHQTGVADEEAVRREYLQNGVDCLVQSFFTDMGRQYLAADFLICRAGATTVAEMACLGKTGLLIPYPHAADDHQTHNARVLVEAGAAEMIAEKDLSAKLVAEKIAYYAAHRKVLTEMARRLKKLGRPEAGKKVVEECLALLSPAREKRAIFNACI